MSFHVESVTLTPTFINILNQLFTGLNFVKKDEEYFFFKEKNKSEYIKISHKIVSSQINTLLFYKQKNNIKNLEQIKEEPVLKTPRTKSKQKKTKKYSNHFKKLLKKYGVWDHEFSLMDYVHNCYDQFRLQEKQSAKPEYFHLSSREGTQRVAHYSVLLEAQKKKLQQTLKNFEKQMDHVTPSQFIDFWRELLPSLTKCMQQDLYAQALTPLLSRILYQWYDKLRQDLFLQETLDLDIQQLDSLLAIDQQLMNALPTEQSGIDMQFRMTVLESMQLKIENHALYELCRKICDQCNVHQYLSIFKVDGFINKIQRAMRTAQLTAYLLQDNIQKHYAWLSEICKDALDFKHISAFENWDDLKLYLTYLLSLQESFINQQLHIGQYDHTLIKKFAVPAHTIAKDSINISVSLTKFTTADKKTLLENLFEYRKGLLSQAHIVDDYYQHLAHYDAVSFYYQYYKIVEVA